ncbi:inositol-pentakisphosphate 2-kinase [Cordyceps fumosorosea ARSEF 2679]|uniref:Inositol-pentakisphosphate 2-kinase n=1 Tax=Cordyceps fumosorosea (strain ARSEF 2679) TaxID=1081104 RepID=A0A167ZEP5_CORFA|nr:inositol-pentakisphosphate 2-kinase [Cordyceps fumosorosea ARSEF 2679]OAA67423.1 inositol-pentakisphosphate 2-kinase [Cordyceps fumosorosea ARSEF 2679]
MALSELPLRQPGPDRRCTDLLQHQRQSKANPPAAPPIEAHHPTTAAATTAITEQPRQQTNHVPVVTGNSFLAVEAPAPAASPAANCDAMWQKHLKHKHLPRGSKPVAFVGEGAANAVFEIKVPQHGASDHNFKGLLLRVAKVPALGQPTVYNYLFQQTFYQTTIRPLLGSHAIHQELVILRNSGIIDELNRLLQALDHTRKPKFRGSFVGQSDWGLLIEDMRPDPKALRPRLLVEFKPKWLSQSRSAPTRAVRCRQCALELQRMLSRPAAGTAAFAPERKPCPLALVDEESPTPVASPFRIAPHLADLPERERLRTSLQHILHDPFLEDLCAQQEGLDVTGPLDASPDDKNFGIAMTIRDCTCFALIPKDEAARDVGDIKIRLGDLDWKDPHTKIQHWRGTEESLIDGGFYTADWILYDGVYYYPPTLCLLEWKPRSSPTSPPDVIQLQNTAAAAAAATATSLPTNGSAAETRVFRHHVADTAALRAKLQPYHGGSNAAAAALANPHRPPPYWTAQLMHTLALHRERG